VITDSAVSKHINSIFAKLGLYPGDAGHRRVLAVLRYLGVDPALGEADAARAACSTCEVTSSGSPGRRFPRAPTSGPAGTRSARLATGRTR
jgi:hypothetical protein